MKQEYKVEINYFGSCRTTTETFENQQEIEDFKDDEVNHLVENIRDNIGIEVTPINRETDNVWWEHKRQKGIDISSKELQETLKLRDQEILNLEETVRSVSAAAQEMEQKYLDYYHGDET